MLRTIVYEENENKQNIIFQRISKNEKKINNIKILQVEEREEYKNMKNFHIENNKIIIDEIYEKRLSNEEKLEKELLETKTTLVNLKYKEIIENSKGR